VSIGDPTRLPTVRVGAQLCGPHLPPRDHHGGGAWSRACRTVPAALRRDGPAL